MSDYFHRLFKRYHKVRVYLSKSLRSLRPRAWAAQQFSRDLQALEYLPDNEKMILQQRLDYYCQISPPVITDSYFICSSDFHRTHHSSAYYIDLAELLPFFPSTMRFAYEFGDVTWVPERPAFVKSRPISNENVMNNSNSILLKLDSVRHFYIPKDKNMYADKIPKLIWRGAAHQAHRLAVLEKFHQHPLCDLGCTASRSVGKPYHKAFMSISQQQRYQFILSIEGNDVASNLKWIMASNSLCFMTRPHFETWFMEGTLIPDYHYVLLRDDYADLEEKLTYYKQNPHAAQTIIHNAHNYLQPFFNARQERLLQLLVMQRYFDAQLPH